MLMLVGEVVDLAERDQEEVENEEQEFQQEQQVKKQGRKLKKEGVDVNNIITKPTLLKNGRPTPPVLPLKVSKEVRPQEPKVMSETKPAEIILKKQKRLKRLGVDPANIISK